LTKGEREISHREIEIRESEKISYVYWKRRANVYKVSTVLERRAKSAKMS
jgi:hypothetical protein